MSSRNGRRGNTSHCFSHTRTGRHQPVTVANCRRSGYRVTSSGTDKWTRRQCRFHFGVPVDFLPVLPPTPPAKSPVFHTQLTEEAPQSSPPSSTQQPSQPHTNGHPHSQPQMALSPGSPISPSHRRSLTISKGHTVSVVLISSALETIAASKEAKRSVPLRESTHHALEMVRSNQGGDRPREIFEPLRLACETRNEKLMIASLDCISKLISYSFFAEPALLSTQSFPSPPPSPNPVGRNSTARASQSNITPPSLVDLVAHTITACHTETTPETVSPDC